ncbi:hypothetical protein B586_05110 [Mycobacterium haemophilum DSM 44634]|nr:hypothetical protein B586_05110 [Mycobacterium haemophilum DSM 44634]
MQRGKLSVGYAGYRYAAACFADKFDAAELLSAGVVGDIFCNLLHENTIGKAQRVRRRGRLLVTRC